MSEKNESAVFKLWNTAQAHAKTARDSLAGSAPTLELLRAVISLETIAAALLALTTADSGHRQSQFREPFEMSAFTVDSQFPVE